MRKREIFAMPRNTHRKIVKSLRITSFKIKEKQVTQTLQTLFPQDFEILG